MVAAVGFLAGAMALLAMPTGATAATTERVSVDSAGNQGDNGGASPALSADGRFVAFVSYATNLVPGDTNGMADVFVHDRQTGTTERVSVDSAGNQGDGRFDGAAISANGRFVSFASLATNLVPGDTNGTWDVFVHDRETRTTERVSVDSVGNQGNDTSYAGANSISDDGRFVAFSSLATNLVPGDTNGGGDVFVHDRQTGATERMSVDSAGNQARRSYFPSISADGRFVAFASLGMPPGFSSDEGIFVRDRFAGTTELVSGGRNLGRPSISADGRVVAWESHISVVIRDRSTGSTTQWARGCRPTISADGRVVVFTSWVSDFVPGDDEWWDVFVRDWQTGATERVSVDSAGTPGNSNSGGVWPMFEEGCLSMSFGPSSISADGRLVAFASLASNLVARDTNRGWDVFVHDRAADAPPVRTNGRPPGMHPAGTTQVTLSLATHEDATCRYSPTPGVAYEAMTATFATTGGTQHATPVGGLRDGESYTFYIRCQDAAGNANPDDYPIALAVAVPGASPGPTERVSVDSAGNQADGGSFYPAISADGRFVAFYSDATTLVPGDTNGVADVFVHDRQTRSTERVSVDSAGNQADGGSFYPAISADGRFVAFYSDATTLVPGDTNATRDVFVHDRTTRTTERVSVDSAGIEANNASYYAGGISLGISADGRVVAFASWASNLVPGDTNGTVDVFVHDRQTRTTERVSVDSAGTEGTGDSYGSAISADGRVVAFASWASNLASGDTNGYADVFVRDRQSGTTERVSVDSAGNQGNSYASSVPAISADGRFVAFTSWASNLVLGDTNGREDVFVHDRQTGTTERVSVDSAGNQADGGSFYSALSADGRFVAFASAASNLVPGDTNWVHGVYGYEDPASDVFVHDRLTGTTERVSVDSFANQGDSHSGGPAISADGRFVAFVSDATNLVPGDTNDVVDVFVHDRNAQSPFQGSPFSVPGTFQAEDFNLGGEGVAYHDAVPGNAGGLYRPNEDVDIIFSSGGVGYVVNNFQTGEWLEYTIDVSTSGTYRLEARVSSEFTTSRFHIDIDGVDRTGSILVPSTGNWNTFQFVGTGGVTLTAGPHILRIYAEQQYFNLDAIRIVAEEATPPTVTINQAAGQPDPTTTSPINFTVVFSEPVTGFTEVDVTITGTAGGTKTVAVTGGPSTYTVAVSGMTSGTVIATIGAGVAQSAAGIPNAASTSTDNTVTFEVAPAAQSPFQGSPFSVPGTLQAEDFDRGGEGVAYHDAVPGNAGGLYRPNEDVDIIFSSGGVGYVVNNFQTGEWLEYTIDVSTSGTYRLEARVSSEFTTSRFHIDIDGVDRTGSILVPSTGNWNTFQFVGTGGVTLTAGPHILRIYAEQQYFNLDSIRIVAEEATPPTVTINGGGANGTRR